MTCRMSHPMEFGGRSTPWFGVGAARPYGPATSVAKAPSLDAWWMPFTANRQFKAAHDDLTVVRRSGVVPS